MNEKRELIILAKKSSALYYWCQLFFKKVELIMKSIRLGALKLFIKNSFSKKIKKESGFTIIEVLIAAAIIVFGL
ncbi:MAG TPA: prepilin-type N-terminal cleavage/methylation domain-containing protein, partial [Cyclobacteriaceae bacterium]